MKKIIISIFLSMMFFICMPSLFSMSVDAKTNTNDIVHSGTSGDLKWYIKKNGEFLLEGNGSLATEDYGSFCFDKHGKELFILSTYKPWLKYSDEIIHAKIKVKNAESLAGILSDCHNLKTVDFTGSDTSKTIDFAGMICTSYAWDGKTNKVKNLDLSMLDTSSAIRMTQLLWGCTELETVNVSGWNTSNVTDMASAFDFCFGLEEIQGLEKWDVSNVRTAYWMFQYCKNLKKLDLSSWDTSNLTSANGMFNQCEKLEYLDVSTWDVSKIENFSNFFNCNVNLKEIDLTKWDMRNAVCIDYMFGWCYKLSGGITFSSKIQSYNQAFYAAAIDTEKSFVINYKGDCSKELVKKICNTNDYESKLKIGHHYSTKYTVDKAATTKQNGSKSEYCKICGEKGATVTINRIGTVKLGKTKYTYDGKTKKPAITVKDSKGNVISSKYYTVSGTKSAKSVGKYTIKITFKDDYRGTKSLSYTIYPKTPSSLTAKLYGHDDVQLKWSKVTGAKGYYIYMKKGTSSYTKIKEITSASTLSYKKANLTDGVKYTFKVVPYFGSNKTESINSKTATITTLKKVATTTVKKSASNKVTVSWTNITGESGYQISRSTSKTGTNIVSTITTMSGESKTITVTKGKTYYYKVRAFKTVDGKKIYGPWSEVKAYKL